MAEDKRQEIRLLWWQIGISAVVIALVAAYFILR